MNLINEMWRIYIEDHGSNNMSIMKMRREAFFDGARAMRDHMNTYDRLASEQATGSGEFGLEVVGGTDHDDNQGEFNV